MSENIFDVVIVGGGYIGQSILSALEAQQPKKNVLLVEASSELESLQFRVELMAGDIEVFPSSIFDFHQADGAKIFWRGEWRTFKEIDFSQDAWLQDSKSSQVLKSWETLCESRVTIVDNINNETSSQQVRLSSPIVELEKQESVWEVSTKTETLRARNIVWTTGMVPFQNSLGKDKAKKYLQSNDSYRAFDADYTGGVFVNLTSREEFRLLEKPEEPLPSFFAIQAKIAGARQLIFVFSGQNKNTLCAFSYVRESIFASPKEMTSYKKAMVRALRGHLNVDDSFVETWSVAQQMPFSHYGVKWKFFDGDDDSLVFVDRERYHPLKNGRFVDAVV